MLLSGCTKERGGIGTTNKLFLMRERMVGEAAVRNMSSRNIGSCQVPKCANDTMVVWVNIR